MPFPTPDAEIRFRAFWRLCFCLIVCLTLCACRSPQSGSKTANLPERHELKLDHLVVRSDFEISKEDPLLAELSDLRAEIESTLHLAKSSRPVVVHLFSDERSYAAYMRSAFPNLPPRRAFFVGSPTELTVYAFWGDNIEEDLRHEYTHGVLHASLRTVPLWLDEGLAEYFETTPQGPERIHDQHAQRLALAVSNGWKPDLARLEKLEDVSQMQRADYQEAWAWVHYLLHDAPGGRDLLIEYCEQLSKTSSPSSFAMEIRSFFPDADQRLTSYITFVLKSTEGTAYTRGSASSRL
ncbi:MAG: DUF1570 domain-containing protein [Planctomycetaceae bacterium]